MIGSPRTYLSYLVGDHVGVQLHTDMQLEPTLYHTRFNGFLLNVFFTVFKANLTYGNL